MGAISESCPLVKRQQGMETRTFAYKAIRKRIEEKQSPLMFQDFGYGDEYSEAPYNDYNDCHGDYYDVEVAGLNVKSIIVNI